MAPLANGAWMTERDMPKRRVGRRALGPLSPAGGLFSLSCGCDLRRCGWDGWRLPGTVQTLRLWCGRLR